MKIAIHIGQDSLSGISYGDAVDPTDVSILTKDMIGFFATSTTLISDILKQYEEIQGIPAGQAGQLRLLDKILAPNQTVGDVLASEGKERELRESGQLNLRLEYVSNSLSAPHRPELLETNLPTPVEAPSRSASPMPEGRSNFSLATWLKEGFKKGIEVIMGLLNRLFSSIQGLFSRKPPAPNTTSIAMPLTASSTRSSKIPTSDIRIKIISFDSKESDKPFVIIGKAQTSVADLLKSYAAEKNIPSDQQGELMFLGKVLSPTETLSALLKQCKTLELDSSEIGLHYKPRVAPILISSSSATATAELKVTPSPSNVTEPTNKLNQKP